MSNHLIDEIKSYFDSSKMSEEDFIEHYGTPHVGMIPHSGRWPWGTGEDEVLGTPNSFLDRIQQLRSKRLERDSC